VSRLLIVSHTDREERIRISSDGGYLYGYQHWLCLGTQQTADRIKSDMPHAWMFDFITTLVSFLVITVLGAVVSAGVVLRETNDNELSRLRSLLEVDDMFGG
jgi:hypothetical protein